MPKYLWYRKKLLLNCIYQVAPKAVLCIFFLCWTASHGIPGKMIFDMTVSTKQCVNVFFFFLVKRILPIVIHRHRLWWSNRRQKNVFEQGGRDRDIFENPIAHKIKGAYIDHLAKNKFSELKSHLFYFVPPLCCSLHSNILTSLLSEHFSYIW